MLKGLRLLVVVAVVTVELSSVADAAEGQIKEPTGASAERMEWFGNLKFGMFIHWGPWSQTGNGSIWQIVKSDPLGMRQKRFELYKTFNPTEFDADAWAEAARRAGMRYVVFVTKHHDGFCNFDTQWTDFKVTDANCPWSDSGQADITAEVVRAFREQGLAVGLYFSHIDWHHPAAKYFADSHWDYDKGLIDDRPEIWQQYVEFERGQVRELLSNYGKIDILWFDLWWPWGGKSYRISHPKARRDMAKIMRMVREQMPGVVVNNRGVDLWGDFVTPEQSIPAESPADYWETSMTISEGGGYWYKGRRARYKSTRVLLGKLAEVASKGGNFLLNVAPRPDGQLASAEVERLKEIGDWLAVNGEAIYGTEASPLDYKPKWGCATRKGQNVYLIVFDRPKDGKLPVRLNGKVSSARLLGNDEKLQVRRVGNQLEINLTENCKTEPAFVLCLEPK